jgi:uncharacterized protein (TIGR03790 family)
MKNVNILTTLIFTTSIISAQQNVDYNDVAVIVNETSQVSVEIVNYFQQQRDIPAQNIIYISATTDEEIDSLTFEQIRLQIENYMIDNNLEETINYLVTTKGVPLKVKRGSCGVMPPDILRCASFDSELALILGDLSDKIAQTHGFLNPYFHAGGHFNHADFSIYLVTRLDGYTKEDVINLIDRSGPNIPVSQLTTKMVFDISFAGANELSIFVNKMQESIAAVSSNGWSTIFHPQNEWLTDQKNVFGYYGINFQPENKVLNNTWVKGSVAELPCELSAATFDETINMDNDLLIADLIAEGATGAHGVVYVNYFSRSLDVKKLYSFYTDTTSMYNLAESYYSSIPWLSWHSVVIGDPKTSIIIDNTVSLHNLTSNDDIDIYPNPATGIFTLELNNLRGQQINIVNQLGQYINASKTEFSNGTYMLDLSNQPTGIYLIQIKTDKGIITKKLVVNK